MIQAIFQRQNPWRDNSQFAFPGYVRSIESILKDNLIRHDKILGLIGSRQVGKTSLLYRLIKYLITNQVPVNSIFYFNLDDLQLQQVFDDVSEFLNFIRPGKQRKYIFIDEIQRLNHPGLLLKELYDLKLNIKLIYSGSSQLEMKSKLKENLVGRVRIFLINHLAFHEVQDFAAPITEGEALQQCLLYGCYPEVTFRNNSMEKWLLVKDIYQSYIEKDIIDFLHVSRPDVFNHLLKLLAAGSCALLSVENLARSLKTGREEIEKYLTILERTFVIKRIYPFFRNYKKEIVKTPKVFFLDNGLRNFILGNRQPLSVRQDTGVLFENFIFSEILKADLYSLYSVNYWRTTNQTEIDFILQPENRLLAVEVKYTKSSQPRSFKTFLEYYPAAECRLITRENFKTARELLPAFPDTF